MNNLLLPLGLAFIMFAVGLGLRIREFMEVFRAPRGLLAALGNQILLLPLIAAALVALYKGRPEFAFGIMILAACPGGPTSNLLTVLAGGNAALSVSATALASVAGMITVPLILWASQAWLLGETTLVTVPPQQILLSVFLVTGLPLMAGMLLNHVQPDLSDRVRIPARRLATAAFAFIVVGAFVSQGSVMLEHALDLGPYVLALNLGTMALGLLTARLMRLNFADLVAVSMEGGLQNAALAIFIAVSLFGVPAMLVPAIMYALMMNITALGLIAWARSRASSTAVMSS
ncbi:bile acid:sodium symporter family protein [Wenzhouxiangella limi]|uniref:Bile acid:sodium symporter family protein n=1 Tax=Wenzhouxiangella limi TaxID=2707351 RepID=A0A845VER2_9GAMM|nr:bile acid:sodium symporter [Wenzhouxiangella limi]NDY95729.1 bile acid:sodium symporter family protein [Wenzhouxiangella limi]